MTSIASSVFYQQNKGASPQANKNNLNLNQINTNQNSMNLNSQPPTPKINANSHPPTPKSSHPPTPKSNELGYNYVMAESDTKLAEL